MTLAHVAPLGATPDAEGNYVLTVGDSPRVLWSAHLDTVHRHGGRQRIHNDGKTIMTLPSRKGHFPNCLGADDGIGVWMLIQMVRANIPGRYVWHVGEECGSRGSRFIARQGLTGSLHGIEIAVAFDRRGTRDIITHQFGDRTASDAFAESFAVALAQTKIDGVDKYAPEHGVFTDTANYADLVAECSNISCGYHKEHTMNEWIDVPHVLALRDAMCVFDASSLVVSRKPGDTDRDLDIDGWEYWHRRHSGRNADTETWRKDQPSTIYGNTSSIDEDSMWIDDPITGEAHMLRADWERTAKVMCGRQVEDGDVWNHGDTWIPHVFCPSCLDIEAEYLDDRLDEKEIAILNRLYNK